VKRAKRSVSVVEAPCNSTLTLDVEASGDASELDWLRRFCDGDEVRFVGGYRDAGSRVPDDGEVLAWRGGVGDGVSKANGGLKRHSEKRIMGFGRSVVAGKS
jgi:hypothetical protein